MAVDVFARTLALASLGNGGGGSAIDTYTKAEIDKMFGDAGTVQVEAVDVLPTEDIKENVIYLVPNGSSGNNFYDECMFINGKWETIGTTEIDLSAYVTKEELEEALADKVTVDVLTAYATKKYVDDALDTVYTKEEVDGKLELIVNFPLRSLKDKVYTKEEILGWFGVTTDAELKGYIAGQNPIYVKYGILLSYNPHYYKFPVDYIAYESANQIKMVFNGLDTLNDKVSKYEIIMNLDGTIIEGSNSNVSMNLTHIEPEELLESYLSKDNETEYTPTSNYNPATKKYVDDSTSDKITINDIPTELPNPESLTIQVNGANLDTYDGSEAKTVNIQAATEEYVKQLISTIQMASFEVVDTLPESDIKSNAIYLVPSNVSGLNNIYDEYIYVNNKWELIGNTSIDLSQYATKEYIDDKDINNVKYTTDNNVELKNHIVTPFGSGLYGSSPENGWTNLAAVKGYNLDAENEIIQTELGSVTLHTNINSKDRPTVETSEGQEQVRYLSDTEIDDKSSSKTTTYSSNKIDSLKPVMLSVPVRTKKDKVYTQEEILAWFKVTSISDLKLLFTRDNPLFAKYGITLSTLPHYYKMNVEYAAFESANQIKLVFLGLDTSNDEPSRFTVIANLDGTIIEGNSNVQLVIEPLSKSSYNDLLDKPTINNIELKDNVSLDDLNLMDKEQVQSAINNVIDDSELSLTKTYSSSKIESLSGIKVLTGTNEKPVIANDLSIGTYVISGVVQSSQSNITNITVPKKLYSVDKTASGAAIWYENPKTSQQTYYEFSLEGSEAPTERLQTYVTTEYLSSATLDGGTWI